MAISATYNRPRKASLYVHLEGEAPFEATDQDLADFGYVKLSDVRDEEFAAEEAVLDADEVPAKSQSEFDPKPILDAGARIGLRAFKVARTVGGVASSVVKDQLKETKRK
jgi:hypothetical protein